jgi:hypothetical protein
MIPTEEMRLSQGRQIISHQDDIDLMQWQEQEISRLSGLNTRMLAQYINNLQNIKKLQIDNFINNLRKVYDEVHMDGLNIPECQQCKIMANHCDHLSVRIYQLSDEIDRIKQDNSKTKLKTSKVIITIAVIITIINIVIHLV